MSIPPRWLGCPRKGKLIGGKLENSGRFIPFKTPLSSRYDEDVPEGNKFDIAMLMSYVESMQLRMGLVVDLTKTDRFYDKRSLTEVGIGHYKLKCEGFGEAPTADQVKEFNRVSSHFFEQHPGEIIGVHCTHGYNRTGFLIISYLVEKEDWSFEAAISAFCLSRPPGIYKPAYLQVLAERLNGASMADVSIPERPAWCNEEEDEEEEAGSGSKHGRRRREVQNEHARFVDGVDGPMFVGPPLREEVQQQCQYILVFDSAGFAGSQPVSMDVQNIGLLNHKPYRVSWKADGTRYMMYIKKEDEVYMVDRDNAVFLIPKVKFFDRHNLEQHLKDTLVDGEMVFDEGPTEVRPRYLIYDIMQFNGSRDISQCDHKTRLLCINKELIQPRETAAQKGLLEKSVEPFGIRAKIFWDVKDARMVLENFVPKVTHKNDGLIFSPAIDPYTPGRCNELMKWKPSDLNSVDFRLKIVEKNQPGLLQEKEGLLYVGGYPQPFAQLDLKRNREAKLHNGRIIECYWDKTSGWNFMRVREDKSFPNGLTTAKSVLHSIAQPVTKEWLLQVVENHRWKPPSVVGGKRPERTHCEGEEDSDLMPPPKTIPRRD